MVKLKGNCLLAQSGGPTTVINASAYGIIRQFLLNSTDEKIYAGIYGIEGILQKKIVDITYIDKNTLEVLKYTPSSAFGSCRYKLKEYSKNLPEYETLFNIFKEYNIRYFFYIGGNDSMDAVNKISEYAKHINYDVNILGIPKTIDNDLVETDHCPGFGSTSKFLCNIASEIWFDINTYNLNSIAIFETMGRDAGWIAASTGIIKNNIKDINHLIYIPEVPFSKEKFLEDVQKAYDSYGKVLITTSEGLKDEKAHYINTDESCYKKDAFGHKQLGGVGKYLRRLVKENIDKRVKLIEFGISQRCAAHCASQTDINEAVMVGQEGVKYALQGFSGFMVALKRQAGPSYHCTTELVPVADVCNKVKNVPLEWMDTEKHNINVKMEAYVKPLIKGEAPNYYENGIVKCVDFKRQYKCV